MNSIYMFYHDMVQFISETNREGQTLENKHITIVEIVTVICIVSRSDTLNSRHAISEPAEHIFGSIRMVIREQTVHKMTEISKKTNGS